MHHVRTESAQDRIRVERAERALADFDALSPRGKRATYAGIDLAERLRRALA